MSETVYNILSGLILFAALFLGFLLWRDAKVENNKRKKN